MKDFYKSYMALESSKIPVGHWQDVIKFSPHQKAWRRDSKTKRFYVIDLDGIAYFGMDSDNLPEKVAYEEDIRGYKDWRPVVNKGKFSQL